jgi:hypothetical protein
MPIAAAIVMTILGCEEKAEQTSVPAAVSHPPSRKDVSDSILPLNLRFNISKSVADSILGVTMKYYSASDGGKTYQYIGTNNRLCFLWFHKERLASIIANYPNAEDFNEAMNRIEAKMPLPKILHQKMGAVEQAHWGNRGKDIVVTARETVDYRNHVMGIFYSYLPDSADLTAWPQGYVKDKQEAITLINQAKIKEVAKRNENDF